MKEILKLILEIQKRKAAESEVIFQGGNWKYRSGCKCECTENHFRRYEILQVICIGATVG